MKIQNYLTIGLIVAAVIFAAAIYSKLPEIVPSHWNALGEVDGYSSRTAHISMFLGLSVFIPLLITWLPKLDPKVKNILTFKNEYDWFVFVMTLFMVGLFVFTSLFALGYKMPIEYYMFPALALLFYTIGNMLGKVKSNYTIGIRLPWTLHSEANWNATHQIAAKIFRYGAILIFLAVFFGKFSFVVFIIALLFIVVYPIWYSYDYHKSETK